MFFLGNKKQKKKQREKVPSWFAWMMGIFVLCAVLSNIFGSKSEFAEQPKPETGTIDFRAVTSTSIYQQPIPFSRYDVKAGSGNIADCWQTVAIRYELYKEDGTKVEDNLQAEAPLRFAVGRGEVIPALERGVMGMREGAERHIVARSYLAYSAPGFSHPAFGKDDTAGFKITLQEATRPDNLPISDLGLRMYDDAPGVGLLAQCTDTVLMEARAWDVHGRPLWNGGTGKIPVRIGKGIAPYAIERGLIGMRKGGKRTLIVPSGYMNPIFGQQEPAAAEPLPAAGALPAETENTTVAPEVTADHPPAAGKQTTESKEKPKEKKEFAWESLPVPENTVIILELSLPAEPDKPAGVQ